MGKKKVWKEWVLNLGDGKQVVRFKEGQVGIYHNKRGCNEVIFSPAECRRLFQKLSGDYRD